MAGYLEFGLPNAYYDAYRNVVGMVASYEDSMTPQRGNPVPYVKGKLTKKQQKKRKKTKAARRK